MSVTDLAQEIEGALGAEIQVEPEGPGRFRIFTPFAFDDGDMMTLAVERLGKDRWRVSDEGSTFMRLSYRMDEKDWAKGTRQKIISNALSFFDVQDEGGVLSATTAKVGPATFALAQAILKVSDLSFLSRERVKSTFIEDSREFLFNVIPPDRITMDWNDPVRDPKSDYTVDCKADAATPLYIFLLANDDHVKVATITAQKFEAWGISCNTLGIFRDQEEIGRKDLSRITDVMGRQFSSLAGNEERIRSHIKAALAS